MLAYIGDAAYELYVRLWSAGIERGAIIRHFQPDRLRAGAVCGAARADLACGAGARGVDAVRRADRRALLGEGDRGLRIVGAVLIALGVVALGLG